MSYAVGCLSLQTDGDGWTEGNTSLYNSEMAKLLSGDFLMFLNMQFQRRMEKNIQKQMQSIENDIKSTPVL